MTSVDTPSACELAQESRELLAWSLLDREVEIITATADETIASIREMEQGNPGMWDGDDGDSYQLRISHALLNGKVDTLLERTSAIEAQQIAIQDGSINPEVLEELAQQERDVRAASKVSKLIASTS